MEEEVSVEELKAAIRKGVIACKINPVFVGSAYKNKGVQELLDAVVDYMPSPVDIPPIKGVNPETGEEEDRPADPKAPFSSLAFKIMTDPYVGKLTYLRVYSGHRGRRQLRAERHEGQEGAHRPVFCRCIPISASTSDAVSARRHRTPLWA